MTFLKLYDLLFLRSSLSKCTFSPFSFLACIYLSQTAFYKGVLVSNGLSFHVMSVHRQSWAVPACWACCGDLSWQGRGRAKAKRWEGEWASRCPWQMASAWLLCLSSPQPLWWTGPGLVSSLDHDSSPFITLLGHCSHVLGSGGRKQLRSHNAYQCSKFSLLRKPFRQAGFPFLLWKIHRCVAINRALMPQAYSMIIFAEQFTKL